MRGSTKKLITDGLEEVNRFHGLHDHCWTYFYEGHMKNNGERSRLFRVFRITKEIEVIKKEALLNVLLKTGKRFNFCMEVKDDSCRIFLYE